MWPTRLGFVILCFPLIYGHDIFKQGESTDLLRITSPEDLGNYLLHRLERNDARFISKDCFLHLLQYAKGLLTFRIWALQMFDSSAKIPSGLLRGHGAALGTFDECLSIKAENTTLGTFRGKYCLGGFRLLNLTSFGGYDFDILEERQSRLLNLADESVYLPWGVCLPDACSARDFRILHLFLLHFTEENCQTEESQTKELDDADIGAICFIGVIVGLIILSTTYDAVLYYSGKIPGLVVLRSFSLSTNISKILTVKDEEDEMLCLHGMRALSMLSIMGGFRVLMYAFAPLINWLDLVEFISDKNNGMIIEAIIAADTFFVVSGMLISYGYMKCTENGGTFNVIVYYLKRIIRLTPALVAAVLIHATLLRHIGSGPTWPLLRDTLLVESCRENWWSSLLYVQNYVNPGLTTICIIQSWQLSADMQLFLLSPLILFPLRRVPKITFGVIGGLLVCAIVAPFLATWVYDLKAVIVTNRSLQDVKNYLEHFYFPLHTRAAPWIIGFILGYLVYQVKNNKLKIDVKKSTLRTIVFLLWAIAGGIMALCVVIGRELIGQKYNWLNHAFHLAFMRPLWALAISWIIFACATGHSGPVNSILSASLLQVISRISYSTYLLNVSLMLLLTHQTRVGLEFGEFDAIYNFFGDIVFSLALGLLWTLAFESPFISLGNVLFGKSEKKEEAKSLESGVNDTK